jgi:hypothetical protein
MTRTLVGRLQALLLLTAFVGGGFGLSDLDALLYHTGQRAASADVAHIELPGGCGAHAEHCVLAVAASLRQLGSRVAARVCVIRTTTITRVAAPIPTPRSANRTRLQRSRAPPTAAS